MRGVRNIFIVWFCTGLWHGADWNFILWGLYFGVLLALEKLFLGKVLDKFPVWLKHIYTLVLVFFSFVIFYIENISQIGIHLSGMFGILGVSAANVESLYYLKSYALLLICACIGITPLPKNFALWLRNREPMNKAMVIIEPAFYILLLIVSTGYLIDSSFNPFLYFRF